MPTDACQFFYQCTNCETLLKPKSGDCCVFCSYGSVPCPPKQLIRCTFWNLGLGDPVSSCNKRIVFFTTWSSLCFIANYRARPDDRGVT